MNENMLDRLVIASPEYSFVLLQSLNDIVNISIKEIIPVYDTVVKTIEIENRLTVLSKYLIGNISCYYDSFDGTLNYFRRLVALDKYLKGYINLFVNTIVHDESDIDPIKRYILMNNASNKIQAQWRLSISNPNYKICRDRLQREFRELL
jgi:hypothetical protein